MLTGDKFETAENIGVACKLIGKNFSILRIKTAGDSDLVCSQK
jgi:magnesium-transporting ATPase (P-type)